MEEVTQALDTFKEQGYAVETTESGAYCIIIKTEKEAIDDLVALTATGVDQRVHRPYKIYHHHILVWPFEINKNGFHAHTPLTLVYFQYDQVLR